jgi:hypothetical protein
MFDERAMFSANGKHPTALSRAEHLSNTNQDEARPFAKSEQPKSFALRDRFTMFSTGCFWMQHLVNHESELRL